MELARRSHGANINGLYWHRYLVNQGNETPFLYEKLTNPQIQEGLITCLELGEGDRYYAHFPNYAYFFRYMSEIPEEYRCFYEVIIGTQKPHYDIDISSSQIKPSEDLFTIGTSLVTRIKERIVKVLSEMGVTDGYTILEFQSHGISRGAQKFSKHIVVNGVAHTDGINAKAFFKKTAMGIRYNQYIDQSVYKTNQQFRIVSCHKFGSDRYKFPDGHEIPEDLVEQSYYLSDTLVGYTENCRILPNLVASNPRNENSDEWTHNLPEELIQEALIRLAKYYDGELPYTRGKVRGNKLELKHIRGTKIVCPLCPKTKYDPHENDHGLIFYKDEQLWFHCWRNDTQNLCLGFLSGESKQVIVEIEEKQEHPGYLLMGKTRINLETKQVENFDSLIDSEKSSQIKELSEESCHDSPELDIGIEATQVLEIPTPVVQQQVRPKAALLSLTAQIIGEFHSDKEIDRNVRHQKRINNKNNRILHSTQNTRFSTDSGAINQARSHFDRNNCPIPKITPK